MSHLRSPHWNSLTVTLLFVSLAGGGLHAEDWPMRGRDWTRNAVSPESNPPIDWKVDLGDGESRNVLWSARLGSISCGDPVVADGLVWVGTNSRDEDASVLMCFRERDGQFLYEYVSPRLENPIRYDWSDTSLASSPLIEGDRLWFCTNRCETVCLNIGPLRDGTGEPEVAWKFDMRGRLGVLPCGVMIGCNANHCSIAAHGDLIYVNTNNARYVRSVPAPDAPSLVCFNKNTGEVVWTDNSPGGDILDVQFGSPLVAEIDGRAQVIMGQGDGWLRSFDCQTGGLIWKFDVNDKGTPRKWPFDYIVATPVFHNNRIYIARGRQSEFCGGTSAGRLCCVDATKQGDVSSELDDGSGTVIPNPNSGLVWEFTSRGDQFEDAMHCTLSSVVIDKSLVIAPDASGLIHCLDAETGEKFWTHDMLASIYSSPLIVDGKVYVGVDEGYVQILDVSPTKTLLAECDMGNSVEASPVLANGVLYVMTRSMLYAIRAAEAVADARPLTEAGVFHRDLSAVGAQHVGWSWKPVWLWQDSHAGRRKTSDPDRRSPGANSRAGVTGSNLKASHVPLYIHQSTPSFSCKPTDAASSRLWSHSCLAQHPAAVLF